MARGEMRADVVLRFSRHRERRIGQVRFVMEPEEKALTDRPMPFFNLRFGWAIMREGFKIMLRRAEQK